MQQKRVFVTVSSDLATDNRVDRSCSVLEGLGYQVFLVGRQKKNSPPMPDRSYMYKRFTLLFEKGALFYATLNIRLFFFLLLRKQHFLFANDLDTLPATYLVSRIKRLPLIYDSHELFTEVPELIDRPYIQKIWVAIEKLIVPRLTEMLTVNNSIAAIFEEKYKLPVRVVRNTPQRIPKLEALEKNKLGLGEGQYMLIIQGSGLNVQRGIEEAVLAMEWVPNAILFLVGDGDVIPAVKTLVSEKHLQHKVQFVARLPYAELMRYTATADLGLALDKPLSLNYQLALPNKVFDYIQAGTPILASELTEIKKLIQTFDCGTVLSEVKPEIIANEINVLLSDSERLLQLKSNCKKAAEIEHWEKDRQILQEVIGRVFV